MFFRGIEISFIQDFEQMWAIWKLCSCFVLLAEAFFIIWAILTIKE